MLRALLLEDDSDCRNIIIEALSDYDIEVEAYHDPTCFLKNTDKCPVDKPCFDFILTDNQMPNMTGLDFLQRLERMECKVPIRNRAIVSGNFSFDDFERIEKLGVKSFNKPCSFNNIFDWLEAIGLSLRWKHEVICYL